MAPDGNGGAFVLGWFYVSADFDGDGEDDLVSEDFGDAFLARYDASGALVFALRIGSDEYSERGFDIVVSEEGGVWMAGNIMGSLDLDEDGQDDLTSAGSFDGFLARFDSVGELAFAMRVGGPESDSISGVASDSAGGVLVVGYFSGSADFDGDGEADLVSAGLSDAFLGRYSASGGLVFIAQSASGPEYDLGVNVLGDGSGGAFTTGLFQEEASFGAGVTLTSAGASDAFLARYSASGDLVFAIRAGGDERDSGVDLAPDGSGGVFVSGYFEGAIDFGGKPGLVSVSGTDAFLARYDGLGGVRSAVGIGGNFHQGPQTAVASDGAGGAFLTGEFTGSVDLSGDGETDLTSAGYSDMFIAHYGAAVVPAEVDPEPRALAISAAPNPARRTATVTLVLDSATPRATVELLDALGRRRRVLHDKPLAAGEHSVLLDAEYLPPGLYVLRVVTPEATAIDLVTLVH